MYPGCANKHLGQEGVGQRWSWFDGFGVANGGMTSCLEHGGSLLFVIFRGGHRAESMARGLCSVNVSVQLFRFGIYLVLLSPFPPRASIGKDENARKGEHVFRSYYT